MTAVLPTPVDLTLPPENPTGVAEVIGALTGAAFHVGVLAAHLTGAAAAAPGWRGTDAAAAADQLGRAATLVGAVHDALTGALNRLERHHERLVGGCARIRALRQAQRDDFAAAGSQLGRQSPFAFAEAAEDPAAIALVERLREAEAGRAREHAALLAELADDAAETALALGRAGEVVGGRGAPGDGGQVLRHLAAELPGWGQRELAARGAALSDALSGPISRGEMDRLADEALPYVTDPAYARAFLVALGPGGLQYLLTTLGYERGATAGPLPALLACALASARRVGTGVAADADPLGDVLTGRYVDPRSGDSIPDQVVHGMAAVLAAAGRRGLPGALVAGWGRQMLARERVQQASAAARLSRHGPDPVVLVVGRLVEDGNPAAAADLLRERTSWDALLHRSWDDGGTALAALVASAGLDQGPGGRAATRAGLEALGTGLSVASGGQWSVNRVTAARVSAVLGTALAAHIDVVPEVLPGADPGTTLTVAEDSALRGLGYLTLDRDAATAVEAALVAWARAHVAPPSAGALPLPASAALPSFLAVRHYGQRLAHALHGHEEMEKAVDRQLTWEICTGWTRFLPGLAGGVIGAVEDAAQAYFRADGSWDNGGDDGPRFTPDDAVRSAAAALPAAPGAAPPAVAEQARAAFQQTSRLLGAPRPPEPPDPLQRLDPIGDHLDTRRESSQRRPRVLWRARPEEVK